MIVTSILFYFSVHDVTLGVISKAIFRCCNTIPVILFIDIQSNAEHLSAKWRYVLQIILALFVRSYSILINE